MLSGKCVVLNVLNKPSHIIKVVVVIYIVSVTAERQ